MKSSWTLSSSHLRVALSQYTKALPDKSNLVDLDSSLTNLRFEVPSRTPPHITAKEYQTLISWKLARGKWRPRLQNFANAHTDETIVPCSTDAFALYGKGEIRKALKRLTELRGCGPASASLVLALVGACFMGDEILETALGERKYTDKAFVTLQEVVKEKCDEMGGEWNAWDLERAVFAAAKLGNAEELSVSKRKRGREEEAKVLQAEDKHEKDEKSVGEVGEASVKRKKSEVVKDSKQSVVTGEGGEKETAADGKSQGVEVQSLRRSKRVRKKKNG